MKRARRETGPTRDVVAAVIQRCGGCCEVCGEQGHQTHHRTPRGMGSTRDSRVNQPESLLRVCWECHDYIERHRAEALIAGWLVSRYDNPATVPVLIERGACYVYLTADGYADNPPTRGVA